MTHTTSFASNSEPGICRSVDAEMASERTSDRAFVGISASLFAASTALTVLWCASMSEIRGMPMPGGWTMSMMWMPMPGQTWIEASASFLAMWVAMMAAMMMPSHVPMLWRYRQAVRSSGESRLGRLTLLAGLGYFVVWSLFGLAVFPLGVVLATVEMKYSVLAHAVPTTGDVLILIAGAVQLTSWKAHHLASCRELSGRGGTMAAQARTAWRQGVHFGLHCSLSCANLTAILLVVGVMDLRAMAIVTAAISAERLAPAGERVAQATGGVVIVAGVLLITRVTVLG